MKYTSTKVCFLTMMFLLLHVSYAFSMPNPGTDKATVSWDEPFLGYNIDILYNGTGGGNVDYIGFCLEEAAPVWPGKVEYNIDSVENYATLGGINKTVIVEGQDLLSDATKWVYWEYTFGTHFDLTKDATLANLVQNTIWYLEDEIDWAFTGGSLSPAEQFYVDKVQSSSYSYDTSRYNIKALNISITGVDDVQSMIIGEPVPEPATMLLFGTGLIGLIGFARRRSRK